MSKRLLFALLSAALAAATLVGLTLPATPAQAELRTVTVRLDDGSLSTVTVDVPPGTPLSDIIVPAGTPLADVTVPTPAPTPTVTEPAPAPTPTTPSTPAPTPRGGGSADPSRPRGGGSPSRQTPKTSDKGALQKTTGDAEKAKKKVVRHAPKAEPQREVKKKLDKIDDKLRNHDGSPAPSNPTFFDALPGPAVAAGVPNFVIQKFRVPIFLLPIYQAAGIQYGIRWEILAAINEIETDYGRNLNVSSAGAVGWMQFLPSTWRLYGVDANGDGVKDPYNPLDAVFAAARYLRAAGADQDIRRAVFAYNHAEWYVDSVLLRAQVIGGLPSNLVGSLTGLTRGRFPVQAKATYAGQVKRRDLRSLKGKANAAYVVESDGRRKGIEIYSRAGAPVVAVNDGRILEVGHNHRLGNFVRLQDVYGNTYTYGHMRDV